MCTAWKHAQHYFGMRRGQVAHAYMFIIGGRPHPRTLLALQSRHLRMLIPAHVILQMLPVPHLAALHNLDVLLDLLPQFPQLRLVLRAVGPLKQPPLLPAAQAMLWLAAATITRGSPSPAWPPPC